MKSLSKVVWSEGMYLGPHHFQAQNRYFEDSLHFATEALWYSAYGLTGCKIDAEALRNGTVSFTHVRGVFRDGLGFDAPDCDPLPAALPIGEQFPPASDRLTVYLTLPARREGGGNCALPGEPADSQRYLAEERVLHDENTGADERPILLGRKNLCLFAGSTPPLNVGSLPVARVLRDGAGGFIFDADFIPPCIQIGASEGLLLRLRRLVEILDDKSATLAPGPGRVAGEYATREIASFWLLHAINSAVAALRHIWVSKRGHPEELFLEMSRLGAALCTFTVDSHPRMLPAYDHEDLSNCFELLDRHIRAHLDAVLPTSCISIPLKRAAPYLFEGEVADSRALGRSQWVFGIRAKMGDAALLTATPQLVKFCSARFVGELVKRALPGLPLTHMAVLPSAVSRKVETQYFSVSKAGPCWDHILQTRQVGIYVPGDFPDAELELLVVLES